jgi:hypothetical protein
MTQAQSLVNVTRQNNFDQASSSQNTDYIVEELNTVTVKFINLMDNTEHLQAQVDGYDDIVEVNT